MPKEENSEMGYFNTSYFWRPDNPGQLVDLVTKYAIDNYPNLFLIQDNDDSLAGIKINPDICLPEAIFSHMYETSLSECRPLPFDFLMSCLLESYKFPLQKLVLNHCEDLSDSDLRRILSCQKVTHLELNSPHLTFESLEKIAELAPFLVCLKLGNKCRNISYSKNNDDEKNTTINFHNLVQLHINCFWEPRLRIDHSTFFRRLSVLDFSDCKLQRLSLYRTLECVSNLKALSLHNVPIENIVETLSYIEKLTNLRKLDIGRSDIRSPHKYEGDVITAMTNLMTNLPSLDWLEICGTNLAGLPGEVQPLSERMRNPTSPLDIQWLDGRRLNYLGLLNCSDDVCGRENIPADNVSGDHNVDQVLTSLENYTFRPQLLLITLKHLYDQLSAGMLTDVEQGRALEHTLRALDGHRKAKDIQICGSASVFYLIKGELKPRLTVRVKRHTIRAILDAMDEAVEISEQTMIRNGCLTLCHFTIPQDLRVISLLLRIVQMCEPQTLELPFICKLSLNLLNSMACQVDNKEKVLVGDLGTFEVMLNVIEKKLEARECDEIMEVAWSLMWNATDETAANCEKFILNRGLEIFRSCSEVFNDKDDLLRNMMGLMGNVAEVDELKHHLISPYFIQTFKSLLDSESDGIEVSYNSCGILANLMLGGPSSWAKLSCHWSSVQEKMRQAISRWPITQERNINYRSFGPILRLVDCREVFEVQYWALWALCNLTKVYKSKYCPLLKQENGVEKLVELFIETNSSLLRKLAAKVIIRCNRFQVNPDAVSDTEDDDFRDEQAGGGDGPPNSDVASESNEGATNNLEGNFNFNNHFSYNSSNSSSLEYKSYSSNNCYNDNENRCAAEDEEISCVFNVLSRNTKEDLTAAYKRHFSTADDNKIILKHFFDVINRKTKNLN